MNSLLNEEGEFACVVRKPSSGWFGESAEKRTPFIQLLLEVNDQSHRTILWFGWLSDGAFDNTIKRLAEVFGFDGDLIALNQGQQTLEGRGCHITTEFEEYKGKQKCKVKWLNSTESRVKPLDAETIKGMTVRAKDIAGAVAPPPTTASTAGPTEPDDDSDVPF